MAEETEAAGQEQLSIGQSMTEGLQPLGPQWRVFALQIATILVIVAALDLVPAFTLGMSSYVLSEPATADLSPFVVMAIWIAKVLIPIWLALNLIYGAARLVLLAKPPAVSGWFRFGRRQLQGFGILLVALFCARFGPGVIFQLLILLSLGWLMTAMPAVAIDEDFTKAWKISEGHRSKMLAISNMIAATAFALFATLRCFAVFIIGEENTENFIVPMATVLAVLIFCVAYSAVGAAIYRRLVALESRRLAENALSAPAADLSRG